jgi:hypothetical protein
VYFMGSSVNVRYFRGGGGVKCHFLNIVVKSANGWIVQGGKVYFPQTISLNKHVSLQPPLDTNSVDLTHNRPTNSSQPKPFSFAISNAMILPLNLLPLSPPNPTTFQPNKQENPPTILNPPKNPPHHL